MKTIENSYFFLSAKAKETLKAYLHVLLSIFLTLDTSALAMFASCRSCNMTSDCFRRASELKCVSDWTRTYHVRWRSRVMSRESHTRKETRRGREGKHKTSVLSVA